MEDAIPQGMPSGLQAGHEATEVAPRPLLVSAGILVAVVIVCQVGLWLWMLGFRREEEREYALHPARHAIDVDQFPQPRLQESPPVDTEAILREERARISSYGWVDPKAGVARIPVDRAMEIIAQKGLPKVAARPRTPGAPRNTSIPPAQKREEARPEEDRPAPREDRRVPEKKDDRPHPESKQGGKP